jgi:hypothetical protein
MPSPLGLASVRAVQPRHEGRQELVAQAKKRMSSFMGLKQKPGAFGSGLLRVGGVTS